MITIKDEIYMLENEIEKVKLELEEMDSKLPENRFRYANKKSELNSLYRKLELLTNNQEFKIETKNTFLYHTQLNTIKEKKLIKSNTILKKMNMHR